MWSQVAVLAFGLTVMGIGTTSGQEYPSKPIRIITSGAGGGSDFISRQIAQGISAPLGQPVIVDNRNAAVATEAVAKSAPDGYNLLVNGGSLWITPILRKTPYDSLRDFSPISLLVREVNVVVVHPSIPAKTIKELIALAKARPGQLNYSSTGVGSSVHLRAELFNSMAGTKIVNVPYKSSVPALTALVNGEVQVAIFDSGLVAPHVKQQKLRALAVTSAEPSTLAPGLPTVADSGLPGYESVSITGIWTAGETPRAIINRLNQEIVRFLNSPDVKERFLNAGEEVIASSPERFAAVIKSEIVSTTKVIKDAGIKVE